MTACVDCGTLDGMLGGGAHLVLPIAAVLSILLLRATIHLLPVAHVLIAAVAVALSGTHLLVAHLHAHAGLHWHAHAGAHWIHPMRHKGHGICSTHGTAASAVHSIHLLLIVMATATVATIATATTFAAALAALHLGAKADVCVREGNSPVVRRD